MIKRYMVYEVYDSENKYIGYFPKKEKDLAEKRAKEIKGHIKITQYACCV